MVIVTEKPAAGDVWRWYWVVTFFFIVTAIAGWTLGYFIVILISLVQFGHSLIQNGSVAAFPVQIRLVYLGITLFGLWEGPRFYVYLVLLVGTFMVAFLGRCGIALVLKRMPWNQEREIRLN